MKILVIAGNSDKLSFIRNEIEWMKNTIHFATSQIE